MGGTYDSERNSYEQTHKKYVVNSRNYFLDHTGNPFGYKNKSAYQEGNEEGDKETSCLGEVAMIEFDPQKVINKDTFVHCKTKERAASFVEWAKKYYENLNKTLYWSYGDEVSNNYHYDTYKEDTAYLIDEDGLYLDDVEDCDDKDVITFGDALLKDTAKPVTSEKEKQTKKTTIRKERKVMNIPSVSKVIENVKTAAATSKDAIIQAQKGTALLAAVKAGLNKGPLPTQVKELINTPYWGDFVTGVMLHTVVPTVTDSKIAKDAVEAANVVASIGLSEHFSWIQDTIKNVIEKTLPDFSKAVVEEAAKE